MVVKRFSAKEERRRVVAVVYDPEDVDADDIGFENHLNVFHRRGRGLQPQIAAGLCLWLNSTAVDQFFRTFSGHTQVNATDLRSMQYPSTAQLTSLGACSRSRCLARSAQDRLTRRDARIFLGRSAVTEQTALFGDDSITRRIQEARRVLADLNFDAERSNERSALVLLALLGLTPDTAWADAT